jgi:hypothetical protein
LESPVKRTEKPIQRRTGPERSLEYQASRAKRKKGDGSERSIWKEFGFPAGSQVQCNPPMGMLWSPYGLKKKMGKFEILRN